MVTQLEREIVGPGDVVTELIAIENADLTQPIKNTEVKDLADDDENAAGDNRQHTPVER